ncbi:flavodoxin-dependent (E)-4-hydroxy-3-methylbut-2-enyl-diphosphate synthase [Filifactor alocis]|uniref:flavodoxin-dependent (E)-4-hydroxy-3-methylbut-2-enyl-diphosphate synthase n=1 Tax=Filifactor alocis TaxID=143361 RepID=UPI0028EB615A|nr:flavodoxin-dependent (E)-4-hydroxy-3-methylbut-2-enyl-diphosphate synthase [Filifactor alocis]
MMNRKNTRAVNVGGVIVGGNHPIVIQSMTNTPTEDVAQTVNQILELEREGCQIVRLAIPTQGAAIAVKEIKKKVNIPLVADIHFNHILALEVMKNGIDALRINPGNIGGEEKVKAVIRMAKEKKIPIRIGVNGGSLDKKVLSEDRTVVESMIQSALEHISILENMDFYDIVVSLKASDIFRSIEAYTRFSEISSYPLHLGITESGGVRSGAVKSAIGIGSLLMNGIGDTIRVSLTANPVEEVIIAKDILKSLDLYDKDIKIISCPTCGRTKIDLIPLAERIEKAVKDIHKPITLAIMGCAVNGPGEAREADIGIAGGIGEAILFKKGEVVRKIKEADIEVELLKEIEKM